MCPIIDHDIRYMHLQDAPYLKEWLLSPRMLEGFPMSDEKETEDTIQCWMGFCRYNCGLTVTVDDIPCAMGVLFLMPYRKVAHHCIFNMIVAPEWQRKGIGSSLLKNLKHLAKTYFSIEWMLIDVFEGTQIAPFLLKREFTILLKQEDYVKDETGYKARLLMECAL